MSTPTLRNSISDLAGLATLRTQVAEATSRRDARRSELSQLIQRLSFTVDAPAS